MHMIRVKKVAKIIFRIEIHDEGVKRSPRREEREREREREMESFKSIFMALDKALFAKSYVFDM